MMVRKKNAAPQKNTAAIYARFSSHNQREESLDAQIRACRAYAESKGLSVVEVYSDSAKTGTTAERENFQRMLEDSGKGQFSILIVHKLDRFSRDRYDSVTCKRKLKINGVKVVSVMEAIDGDSPENLILESVLEGMAQYYSENLSREVMKGMKESAYKATHLGGMPPLGFDVDPVTKKYVINENEAGIVRTIFDLYAEGVGYNQILRKLNGMGHRTKRGEPFGKNSLNGILKNEKYTGRFVFNKKQEKDVAGNRCPQLKPEDEWIVVENGLPAIVDREVFDRVQARIASNSRSGGAFKAKAVYLLSGLIYCGACGSVMHGNTRKCGRNKITYSSYRCANRAHHKGCQNKEISKNQLEAYVLDELYFKLFSETSIRRLAELLNDYNKRKALENNEELALARRELADTGEKISKVVRLVSESGVSIDTVKADLKRLEERKSYLEGYVKDASLNGGVALISHEKIYELISRSRDFVRQRNIPECRSFISSYIEKVVVYEERVEVLFKIHVPGKGDEIEPMKSGERLETLQREYRQAG